MTMYNDLPQHLVTFSHVSRTYVQSKSVAIHAIRDVSFSVGEGEFIAITGHSGSGKSTLLNLIGLIDTPSEGSVIIGGKDIKHMNEHERTIFRLSSVGFVFQFFNLIDTFTALENIIFQLRLQEYSAKEAAKKAGDILGYLDLTDRAHLYPRELSGGEQQRVAIGRAIAKDSTLILADEPTAHLDTKNAKAIMELLRRVNNEYKRTIIVVTHEPEEAKVADREVVLQDGCILSIKTHEQAHTHSNGYHEIPMSGI